MSIAWSDVERFLLQRADEAARRFPMPPSPKVLCFQATTGARGQPAALSAHERVRIGPGEGGKSFEIVVRGQLAHAPAKGDNVTVTLTRLERFRGFQIRTLIRTGASDARLVETLPTGDLLLHGRYVYTMHNSPNSLNVFETIPWGEVEEMKLGERHVLAAVGERANISPRFAFHYEVTPDSLTMFHGEGYTNKTYLNIQRNEFETRAVVGLDDFCGYCFHGVTERVPLNDTSPGVLKVLEGFEAGGWGAPQRVYRFRATHASILAPG